MSCNVSINDVTIPEIKLIVIDLSNTVFDFTELWLKEAGYISQTLAENFSTNQGDLFRKRAMLIKSFGINPETGEIDPNGALFTSSTPELKALLRNILYINNVPSFEAERGVDYILDDMIDEINPHSLVTLLPDAEEFLKKAIKFIPIASLSKRYYENAENILSGHNAAHFFTHNYTLFNADKRDHYHLEQVILFDICNDLSIEPENVLLIGDNMYDLCLNEDFDVNRILVNRVSINDYYLTKYNITNVVSNLEDIQLK